MRDFLSVSVVIPMYNASATIQECLTSVLQQQVPDMEVIVVNDGSTDSSATVVENFIACNEGDIRLINQPNQGVSAARNKGISLAKGYYIAFLDADDAWGKEKLATQLDLLKKHPEIALSGVSSHGKADSFILLRPHRLLWRNVLVTSGIVAQRSVIIEAGGFPEGMNYSEDLRLWLIIAMHHPCAYLNRGLVKTLRTENVGLSSQLKKMEKAELNNIRWAREVGMISGIEYCLVACFSIIKYGLRVIRK